MTILRNAELATADGMPLVWASRLLRSPLPARVTGADLVPALAEAAAGRRLKLYLLGGKEEVAHDAAQCLRAANDGLRIAGVSSPFVHTQGSELADAEAADERICAQINAAAPDILLVAFGNPKQELWFQRNRHGLRVPVTIGIGGTFNFITGTVSRAPRWMQRTGLEWIYRIAQEPRRLWKRYAVGLCKVTWLCLPLIVAHRLRTVVRRPRRLVSSSRIPPLFVSDDCRLRLVPIPETGMDELASVFEPILDDPPDILLLDVRHVCWADSDVVALLTGLLASAPARGFRACVYGCRPSLRRELVAFRVWDLFERACVSDLVDAIAPPTAGGDPRCLIAVDTGPENLCVAVYGELHSGRFDHASREHIEQLLGDRHILIDLTYCTSLDTAGIGFLLALRDLARTLGRRCQLGNPSGVALQALKMARLPHPFTVRPNAVIE